MLRDSWPRRSAALGALPAPALLQDVRGGSVSPEVAEESGTGHGSAGSYWFLGPELAGGLR